MQTTYITIAKDKKHSFITIKKLLITLISAGLSLTVFAEENSTTTATKAKKTTTHQTKTDKVAPTPKKTSTKAEKATPTPKKTPFSEEDLTIADSVDCEDGTPCMIVSSTSKEVLKEISNGQTSSVTDTVTPHFDFRLMTKYALGHHWKEATDEQQDQLVDLFKQLLIYTYTTALSKFSGAKIHITGSTINPNGKMATVISQVSLPSSATNNTGQPIKIEYSLANSTGAWKAYDIKIENASLVTTYRNQFSEIVQKDKVIGLIKQLQTKVSSLKKAKSVDDNA